MTAADVITFARTLEGKTLHTRRGKPFQVSVVSGRIVYTRLGDAATNAPSRPE